jgi:hypothetical protein
VELNKADVSDVEPVAFERHPVCSDRRLGHPSQRSADQIEGEGRPSTPMMAWPRVGSGSTYG